MGTEVGGAWLGSQCRLEGPETPDGEEDQPFSIINRTRQAWCSGGGEGGGPRRDPDQTPHNCPGDAEENHQKEQVNLSI